MRYRLFKHLSEQPQASQRQLSEVLGVSVGSLNDCVNALKRQIAKKIAEPEVGTMRKHIAAKQTAKTAWPNPPQSAGAELVAITRAVEKLKADPQALQRVMQRAGIVTGKGKLTKEFGG